MSQTESKDNELLNPVTNNSCIVPTKEQESQHQVSDVTEPPDGGLRAWLVCFASFWVNGTLFGVINSAGVIAVKLGETFADGEEKSVRVSLVGSLCIGMTFLLSPVASILTDKLGIRRTSFTGGILVVSGMLASSLVESLELLYLTYGVIVGLGAALAYTPSLVIIGHYFKRRLGLVNGIVTAGSSLFTMIMPLLLKVTLEKVGLSGTYQILAALMGTLILCALIFKPLLPTVHEESHSPRRQSSQSKCAKCCNQIINTSVWKKKKYVVWAFAFPVSLFGYFVPYSHLVKYVNETMPDYSGEVLITCIGAASGVGRIAFGTVADSPKISRIFLQQISFFSLGILTMLLAAANKYWILVVTCLGLGIFDGCFISLLGPIAFDIVGCKGASQAIGFLLGLCSGPLTFGPPIAAFIYESMGHDYKLAFIAAGVPPIVGALLMFTIKCVKETNEESEYIPEEKNNILIISLTSETKISEDNDSDNNDVWKLRPEFQSKEKNELPKSKTTEELNNHRSETLSPSSDENIFVERHSTC